MCDMSTDSVHDEGGVLAFIAGSIEYIIASLTCLCAVLYKTVYDLYIEVVYSVRLLQVAQDQPQFP